MVMLVKKTVKKQTFTNYSRKERDWQTHKAPSTSPTPTLNLFKLTSRFDYRQQLLAY